MSVQHPPLDLAERLRRHRALARVPETELSWLAARGVFRRFQPGEVIIRKGYEWDSGEYGLEVVLSGSLSVHRDRGGRARKIMGWQAGDVTGLLPFSRMGAATGETIADTALEMISLSPTHFPDLIRECPAITAVCVHEMIDRARVFKASDLQDEKMVSLGKLSAGLAHELNNPASAVARSARLLQSSMAEADRAARHLARVGLTPEQLDAVDRVRDACMRRPPTVSLSPLERADREDEIAEWLEAHGADGSAVDALADTSVTLDALDAFSGYLEGAALDAALDWVAAGCEVRMLAAESERAGSKISELVSAMKRLTHMDRAPVAEPLDVEQGLRDTLMVLGHKARDKSVSLKLEVAPRLPRVQAVGGELEQVWMNILDNALDAVDRGGSVSVTAKPEGRALVVRVIDDGPGIPPEYRDRVFDPFFTTKEPGEGTGLGLDIARVHLRRRGGDIDFDSRPGRTEFRVTLPLSEVQGPESGGAASP
ncbi:MAG: ATP-binding protein [Gemmatimonadota bacterium]|jgi:signal transduction histidine kinase